MINSLTSDQHSGSKAGWPVLIQINTGIAAAYSVSGAGGPASKQRNGSFRADHWLT
jgi:hypothetical protein